MKLSGAEITIKQLERCGIKTISGIPGGSNLPIFDALLNSDIQNIMARHEQGSGFIAHGMARSTGQTAVCMATSGPGATNLVTAIADAMADSTPILAITGQVPTALIGTNAFQEVDFIDITKSICKKSYAIKSAHELLKAIPEAIQIAQTGRPGPVIIDIPKDIQIEIIEFEHWPEFADYDLPTISSDHLHQQIIEATQAINDSEKPILFIGGGAIHSDASSEILQLAERNNIPIITSLMGIGAIPSQHELNLGMIGMHGKKSTNRIMHQADTIIALGVRFDDRAIGNAEKFCPGATIIHIDIDAKEINKIKECHIGINCDLKSAMQKILPEIKNNRRSNWIAQISAFKIKDDFGGTINNSATQYLFEAISSAAGEDAIITTDVGQHQMWAAQYCTFKNPRSFLTSGGIGTMGFGLPAAIGAALANPDKKIICISGDGSIQMNIQELATMAEHQLNISLIIINNQQYGMVKQQQELFYQERYSASKFGSSPDFGIIAKGYGITSPRFDEFSNYEDAIRSIAEYQGPAVLDLPFADTENVYPMVPPGCANTDPICVDNNIKVAS